MVFVPAGEKHRFEEVTEELTALVAFGPGQGDGGSPVTPGGSRSSPIR
ncbi:hypothetical protein [Micromonospora inyonensis]|nr:hypothetical protein [Micromonospora inyonensis]